MLLIKDSQTTHNLNDSLEEYSHYIGIKKNNKLIEWCSPFGIPHGPFVRALSKKSKSYFRAGGYVSAT